MRLIYLILICFVAPVAAVVAWIRGRRDPTRRERLADRFGRPQLSIAQPVIWLHAASMGEVQAGVELVRRLLARYPEHEIVLTTMTTTGAARVKSSFAQRVTHCYLPYDLPFAVRGFLDRCMPQMAIILETELWPNLLQECRRREIPVIVASARISTRTAGRYRRFAGLFRGALGQGVTIAAQSSADAERFRGLGASHVLITGNIKFDIEVPAAVRQAGAELRRQFGERFVWVAGSTHLGEEVAVLQAHRELLKERTDALLVLVPRHPQRFEEVRTLLRNGAWPFISRSTGAQVDSQVSVLLIDTMGELLSCYAAANVAFVGGSLVPVGGHNLLEPAALAVPVVCGSYLSNTQDIAELLIAAEGIKRVASAQDLAGQLCELLRQPVCGQAMAQRATAVLAENRGAVERTLAVVVEQLPRAMHAELAEG